MHLIAHVHRPIVSMDTRVTPAYDGSKECHRNSDFSIDIGPHISYKPRISLTERTSAGDTG